MFLRLLLLFGFLFPALSFADYHGDSYDPPSNDYEYRICKLRAVITVERLYLSEKAAKSICAELHKTVKRGCSVRYLGYGRGYGAFYSNEWIFEGKARTWKRAKRSAFSKYESFADRLGWGQGLPHLLYFSRCSG